ncbi:MAG: hypothetical protein JXB26_13705 [Candidatus Aminicenantes bacterium]|nr:hypothetical protein [Candidatus Aminicenantes bacterium]
MISKDGGCNEAMYGGIEKLIVRKAIKCVDSLRDSIKTFHIYLDENSPSRTMDFYQARNLLKNGNRLFQDVLTNTRKLLGPRPAYASSKYEEWRESYLRGSKLLTAGETVEGLAEELKSDDFVSKILEPDEIDPFVKEHFESQRTGRRRICNIKVRIIITKLESLINEAEELHKTAMKKQQDSL